jgi:hypothetical protein
MKIQVNSFKIKFLVILICLAQLSLLSFWAIKGYTSFQKQSKSYLENFNLLIDQRNSSLSSELSRVTRDIGDDLIYAKQLPSLNELINSDSTAKDEESKIKVNRDLLEFLRSHPSFLSLSYVSLTGREVAKAECAEKSCQIISADNLTDTASQDYFLKLNGYGERDVFIFSPQRLAKYDNEEIIVAAIPLSDYSAQFKGFLVADINSDYFLDSVKNSKRPGEKVVLVDNSGRYVADTDEKGEANENNTIFDDYPQLSKDIFSGNSRRWWSNSGIFSFYHVYPTAGSYSVHQGAEKIYGLDPEDKYYWVLVSISDRQSVDSDIRSFKVYYFVALAISVLATLFIIGLVLALCFGLFRQGRGKRKS